MHFTYKAPAYDLEINCETITGATLCWFSHAAIDTRDNLWWRRRKQEVMYRFRCLAPVIAVHSVSLVNTNDMETLIAASDIPEVESLPIDDTSKDALAIIDAQLEFPDPEDLLENADPHLFIVNPDNGSIILPSDEILIAQQAEHITSQCAEFIIETYSLQPISHD